MSRKIAIALQKGGTGKTTSAINIAAGLARGVGGSGKKRVLLVDMDPQANTTSVFLSPQFVFAADEESATTKEVLVNQTDAAKAIQPVALDANGRGWYESGLLHILPAHIRLARAELDLLGAIRREDRLASALRKIESEFDYIIIDCPPSLGLLTLNALMAANEVIIPVEPGYFPLIGIGLLQQTINDVAQVTELHISGVVPTLQSRTSESRETLEMLGQMFGDKVLPAIPDRVAIRNAHAEQIDIFGFATDASSKVAAEAYANLVREIDNGQA